MADFKLSIVTPEGRLFEEQVLSMNVPGVAGFFGVMAHHTPMLSASKAGALQVVNAQKQTLWFAIGVSTVDIHHGGVTVLADMARPAASESEALKLAKDL